MPATSRKSAGLAASLGGDFCLLALPPAGNKWIQTITVFITMVLALDVGAPARACTDVRDIEAYKQATSNTTHLRLDRQVVGHEG